MHLMKVPGGRLRASKVTWHLVHFVLTLIQINILE